jgi:signal transduction histidine kinase/ActR/RegA family two-component response regulator
MGRYFKYILLTTFIGAILVIVFLQFNSNRSINQLINGNEDLLMELSLKNGLQELQTDIVTLESKVRGIVIKGVPKDSFHLLAEINKIQGTLQELDSLQTDSTISPLLIDLNLLVQKKINFSRNVLDTFGLKGKAAAEGLVNIKYSTQLDDSIAAKASRIDELHQVMVTALIKKADKNGGKAKTLGTIMAVLAALASIFTFGNVTLKVRQQQLLIEKLNASEKKVREAARIKENFMANMSHEIRTPLNAILGFTNLIQRKDLDNESREYVQTIQKSSENLLTIINDILDLSKIEAGMMRIEAAPFSIRGLVHSIKTMFQSKVAEKNLQLVTVVDSSIPDTLEGDAVRLTQILVNLIGNALKFTAQGIISVSISNNGIQGNKINTGIVVHDSGIGINQENLKDIFKRFHQAEESVTRKYGGTGLGLAIVNDLVLLQNGQINVESEAGKGTTFHIQLPYKIAEEQAQTIRPADQKGMDSVFTSHVQVLVVEDNEINQSLIRHLFAHWNLQYDIVNNGKAALDILAVKKYDLILMDIQMPEMDGYTAAREIRNKLKLNTPIVAMTAHAMAGEREKCISFGMNEYISKPIREELLHELIIRFTAKEELASLPERKAGKLVPFEAFRFINLSYMQEISGGDIEYEKTVTGQFLEAIPNELKEIEKAWEEKNRNRLKQVAHNLKTTVSIMGLDEQLQPYLDILEHAELNDEKFRHTFNYLTSVCNASVEEAQQFYSTI